MRYYHGGAGHLQKHQILLRASIRMDVNAAFDDAAAAPANTGAVYEVIPQLGRVRIVRVVQVLTQAEREAAMRRLTDVERAL